MLLMTESGKLNIQIIKEYPVINTKFVKLAAIFSLVSFSTAATEMALAPKNNSASSTGRVSGLTEQCGGADQKPCLYVVSNKHINRIITPYEKPSLKMDAVDGLKFETKGNVIYLSMTGGSPVAGFITEGGNESNSIKFVLNPQPTTPQEIVLKSNQYQSTGSALARRFEKSSPRTDTIKSVMGMIAKGQLPSGYTMKNLSSDYMPECRQSGLAFDFYNGQFVSGGDYVITIGTVTNNLSNVVKFRENNCYSDKVVAVSAYPAVNLLPNEKSEVYVMFYRNKPNTTRHKQRQSLIGGGNE